MAPSVKVTVPVGAPPETVALNVIVWPNVAGCADDAKAVVVVAAGLVSATPSIPPIEMPTTFCPTGTIGVVDSGYQMSLTSPQVMTVPASVNAASTVPLAEIAVTVSPGGTAGGVARPPSVAPHVSSVPASVSANPTEP